MARRLQSRLGEVHDMNRRQNNEGKSAASRIALGALALSSALIAGCSVEAGAGVDVIDTAESQLFATWYTIDESGYEIDCHAVADVVRISSYDVDTGEVYVDVFDCALEAGTTAWLPVGDYDVDVDLVLCGEYACADSPYIVDGFTVETLITRDGAVYDLGEFELIAPPGPAV